MPEDIHSISLFFKSQMWGIEVSLKDLKKYQNTIEVFLDNEKSELTKAYKTKLSTLNDEDDNDYLEYSELAEKYHRKYSEIGREIPHNFRASFLIQIIAFIEYELKDLCEQCQFFFGTKYSLHDLKGNSDIDKARQYLSKSCNVNFDNLNPEWQFILMAKRVRNKLVHHQGFVKKSEKDWRLLNDFISKKEYFELLRKTSDYSTISPIQIQNRLLNDELINKTEMLFKKLIQNELMTAG